MAIFNHASNNFTVGLSFLSNKLGVIFQLYFFHLFLDKYYFISIWPFTLKVLATTSNFATQERLCCCLSRMKLNFLFVVFLDLILIKRMFFYITDVSILHHWFYFQDNTKWKGKQAKCDKVELLFMIFFIFIT